MMPMRINGMDDKIRGHRLTDKESLNRLMDEIDKAYSMEDILREIGTDIFIQSFSNADRSFLGSFAEFSSEENE